MRQVVERAFALLKGRFRRLKYLHMSIADLIPSVILACCVLHNLCLEECDDIIDDFIEEQIIDERISRERYQIRPINEPVKEIVYNDVQGPAKRNYIASLIT